MESARSDTNTSLGDHLRITPLLRQGNLRTPICCLSTMLSRAWESDKRETAIGCDRPLSRAKLSARITTQKWLYGSLAIVVASRREHSKGPAVARRRTARRPDLPNSKSNSLSLPHHS